MSDAVSMNARAAAHHLAGEFGPSLIGDVEAALDARQASSEPDRYFDPISLGGLLVSIASLAWTIYNDLKHKTSNPSADVVARTVRVELRRTDATAPAQQDRIIDVVVRETMDATKG